MNKFLKKGIKVVAYILAIIVLIVVIRAFDSRQMPKLYPWHTTKIGKELLLQKDYTTIDSYLKDEDAYIRNAFAKMEDSAPSKFNRFNPKSDIYSFPNNDNLNASFVFDPGIKNTKGVILLLHGLSDSPFHMRDLGEVFKSKGFYVLGLRLPGHGTLPSGLLNVRYQHWAKATKWGATQLKKIAKERMNVPFYMGGFSTGGALILNYTYKSLSDTELHTPEKLFLFSPAIGVSKMAKFSAWHKSLSWISYFKKYSWLDILPEYDPAKYNSFTKNAGRQIYLLTLENKKLVDNIVTKNSQNEVPPIITFQSLVDATVLAEDLIEMYQKIGTVKDKLFLFDINRAYEDFMLNSSLEINPKNVEFIQASKPQLHMLLNTMETDSILGTNASTVYKKELQNTFKDVYPNNHSVWPNEFFAISHVSVPISPNNMLYGKTSTLGKMAVHGEKDVLLVSPNDLMRIRYNPFFELMKKETINFIKE